MQRPRLQFKSLDFTIAGDPVPQQRPHFTKSGHAYTPTKTRNFQALVKLAAQNAMKEQGIDCIKGAVQLKIIVHLRTPTSKPKAWQTKALNSQLRPTVRPDLSNVLKAVEDGLNGVAYLDDKQIVSLNISKWYSAIPRVIVVVQPWAVSSGS